MNRCKYITYIIKIEKITVYFERVDSFFLQFRVLKHLFETLYIFGIECIFFRVILYQIDYRKQIQTQLIRIVR